MDREPVFLVTCEHADNVVPTAYEACFQNDRQVLKTHQAFDLGALELAKELAHCLDAILIQSHRDPPCCRSEPFSLESPGLLAVHEAP